MHVTSRTHNFHPADNRDKYFDVNSLTWRICKYNNCPNRYRKPTCGATSKLPGGQEPNPKQEEIIRGNHQTRATTSSALTQAEASFLQFTAALKAPVVATFATQPSSSSSGPQQSAKQFNNSLLTHQSQIHLPTNLNHYPQILNPDCMILKRKPRGDQKIQSLHKTLIETNQKVAKKKCPFTNTSRRSLILKQMEATGLCGPVT